ncbi:hypothetical protein AVEN_274607-1 [Araneus ventricosus]|uniref:Uncharacterized protein n=1 Tax=Araneus ventricosus TaxID=182803 RepID=A0A4Y2FAB0_ARAVE|nr:hypothetical protein AVEN_274607-1 [Araneus ventricosus]
MSNSDRQLPLAPVSECECADSVPTYIPACSPVCRRTRSQVSKRSAKSQKPLTSQLDVPSSVEEIRCAMNVEHCVTISTDTSLDNTAGSSSSNIADKATNLDLKHLVNLCR